MILKWISVCSIVLPILCLIGVRILSGSVALSNFAFIYGAVPTPPLVTVYATEYSINPQEISMAVCVSSVLSLPLLFVASKATALAIAQVIKTSYTIVTSRNYKVLLRGHLLVQKKNSHQIKLFILEGKACLTWKRRQKRLRYEDYDMSIYIDLEEIAPNVRPESSG